MRSRQVSRRVTQNTFMLFIFVYVSFREEKQDENTANTALNKTIILSLPDVVDRCVNLSDIYMTR